MDNDYSNNVQDSAPDYDPEAVAEARTRKNEELRKIIAVNGIGEGATAEEATNIADEETFKAEQERAVGAGEIDEAEALENLIDRKTAQFCTWFEKSAPSLVEKGCEYVGTAIGFLLGNTQKGKEMGQKVGRFWGNHPLIKKGAGMIAKTCKLFVDRVKRTVAHATTAVKHIAKALFG